MDRVERQKYLARRAYRASVVIGVLAFGFFLFRGEAMTGIVLGGLLAGGGYFEYQRRIRDLGATGELDAEDPFDKRDRSR